MKEITQHYVDVGGRRVHYRRAGNGSPVVLLHASPRSSAALAPLLAATPDGVASFAFDTPGFGYSEPLALPGAQACDFADALELLFDALGIGSAPVYGTHTGAAIGLALAVRRPARVTKLLIDGLGVFNETERADVLAHYLPRFNPQIDGTHLTWLWSRVRDQFLFFPWNNRGTGTRLWRPLPSPGMINQVALDFLTAGDHYRTAYAAAFSMRTAEYVPQVTMPCVIGARLDDMLLPHLGRLENVPPNVTVTEFPSQPDAWQRTIWTHLNEGIERHTSNNKTPVEPLLPQYAVANSYTYGGGHRLHLRGKTGGNGKPLILLHDSPGGARGLDGLIERAAATRPVVAFDLPGHGDSSPIAAQIDPVESILDALHRASIAIGLETAEIEGEGTGAWLACALAERYPDRYSCSASTLTTASRVSAHVGGALPPGPFEPDEAGAHLLLAWQHMRDQAILGTWSSRHDTDRHDFGDAIDVDLIHRQTIEALKESPDARNFRSALAERHCASLGN